MESYSSARAFECPRCGRIYSNQGKCEEDGARLKAADDLREALEIDERLPDAA